MKSYSVMIDIEGGDAQVIVTDTETGKSKRGSVENLCEGNRGLSDDIGAMVRRLMESLGVPA